jgi:predicted kinase
MRMRTPTPIVVVTGPPASGKSRLAETLASELCLPLIAKDAIKEALLDAFGVGDREWSQRLGQATYPLLYHFLAVSLRAGKPCVVEGTFGPESADDEFRALHERLPFDALQIHCSADLETLHARYTARAHERHPGDVDREILEEVRALLLSGRWRPLALPGETILLDTTSFERVDHAALLARAARHVARGTA